jgi:hypothetical protein
MTFGGIGKGGQRGPKTSAQLEAARAYGKDPKLNPFGFDRGYKARP